MLNSICVIDVVRCTEVVRFSECPLWEVPLYLYYYTIYTYTICTCTLSGKKRKQQSGTSGPQGKKPKIIPAGINSCLSVCLFVSEMGVVMLTCFKLLQLAHSKLHATRGMPL